MQPPKPSASACDQSPSHVPSLQVRQLEQKAHEAELALEEQHVASQKLLEGRTDYQSMSEELAQQVQVCGSHRRSLGVATAHCEILLDFNM